jgi:hypothetical protein
VLAVCGLRQQSRRHGFALIGLAANGIFLLGLAILMVLTKGGTTSA